MMAADASHTEDLLEVNGLRVFANIFVFAKYGDLRIVLHTLKISS